MSTATRRDWFDVDVDGLAKLLERRGKAFALFELVQNAYDEDCTRVLIDFKKIKHGLWGLVVTDDSPEGFSDLTHAFTMFAPSKKKADAEKRGMFNLGEKLVLALCSEATITTTTGQVIFEPGGRRQTKVTRPSGSEFSGLLKISEGDAQEIIAAVKTLIPAKPTTFNGQEIPSRTPLKVFDATLPTVLADQEGEVRKTTRKAQVRIYDPFPGEDPMLYEMGIPVVETNDRWHVDVQQKVPLNTDRDNVPPSYLRLIRVLVVNEMQALLTKQDATATWVREATADERVTNEAVTRVADLAFGKERVAFDPSDLEANKLAASQGMTVVGGGALSPGQWANMRRAEAILPASRVTPSPKVALAAYQAGDVKDKYIPVERWTDAMLRYGTFVRAVAPRILGHEIAGISMINDSAAPFRACYGRAAGLTVNVAAVGYKHFSDPREIIRLLIHELAHDTVSDHLAEEYHDTLCDLGAAFFLLALRPDGATRYTLDLLSHTE